MNQAQLHSRRNGVVLNMPRLLPTRWLNIVSMRFLALICICSPLSIDPCHATQKEKGELDAEKQQINKWMNLYGEIAQQHELKVIGDEDVELPFYPKPLLKYTNPVRRNQQHGALFVWTRDGRPEAVGTFWSKLTGTTGRRIAFEFHSLSQDRVVAEYKGKRIWSPRVAGIEFRPIPDAVPPADSAKRRLVQLRAIARDFSAGITTRTNFEGRSLRLLPQPVYRYESPKTLVLDGGLFTFVMGTDPELILLIEARKAQDDGQWYYAAARFTNHAMDLQRNGAVVWSCVTVSTTDRNGAYYYNPQVIVRERIID